MPTIKEEGKDTIIFVSKEEHEEERTIKLDAEEEYGLIKPNGDINWNCPCLQGMADGPCGESFKAAFSCFHYSTADPKGSDCIPEFKGMQSCFQQFPELYEISDDEKGNEVSGENSSNRQPGDDGDTSNVEHIGPAIGSTESGQSELAVENPLKEDVSDSADLSSDKSINSKVNSVVTDADGDRNHSQEQAVNS